MKKRGVGIEGIEGMVREREDRGGREEGRGEDGQGEGQGKGGGADSV